MNSWKLRLPDGREMSGQNRQLLEGIHVPGFIIGSFENTSGTLLSIPDIDLSTADDLSDLPLFYPLPDESTSRQRHEQNVAKAAAHHSRHDGKTVISRVICSAPVSDEEVVFNRLCAMYPDACVFKFSTSPTGTWIGASPELLLEAKGGRLRTMSLAGTRPAGMPGEWDAKNIHEQELVTTFILDTLRRHNLQPDAMPVESRVAGNIEHLLTQIEAPIPSDWSTERLALLLHDLSPTPALGGYPREDAMQLINRLEQHQRGYYGGFFGYIESACNFRLNVNLRSALLTPEATYIFAGGGITADSIPEEEWEETCRKANTVALALI